MKTEDLSLFLLVADCGSITQAADAADLPVANVSRRLRQLEGELGFPLFARTTRQLRITEEGRQFYQQVQPMLTELNATIDNLRGQRSTLSGKLRLQLFADSNLVLPFLQKFQQAHPEVTFDVEVPGKELDLLEHGFDLGMRIGPQRDSSEVARLAGKLRRMVVASPDYLSTHGRPDSPQALKHHNCILFRMPNGRLDNQWQIQGGEQVEVTGDFVVNQQSLLDDLVCSGHGIGFLPSIVAIPLIQQGRLVELFEGDDEQAEEIWLIYPSRRHPSLLSRAFIDFALEEVRGNPAFQLLR
ncbi:LysR family transcriptional regulator [Ferrimonas futtsuensis]|uniref:LysR family transcriptional regulator n=1 Tax=Ferrimonas futtsuensis TaxID=364764 RepID=UPI0003FE8140|nr:LysR family transcriptional regulator [Ferrimonas futtsuensis]